MIIYNALEIIIRHVRIPTRKKKTPLPLAVIVLSSPAAVVAEDIFPILTVVSNLYTP